MMKEDDAMRRIVKDAIINAKADEVYQKWTTKEGLLSFFGADVYIELRKNGPYEIYFLMDQEPGLRGSEDCVILDFEPNKFISFSWNVPPIFEEERSNKFQSVVTITFKSQPDNHTHVRLTNVYLEETTNIDEIILYFERAWGTVMDNLNNVFK